MNVTRVFNILIRAFGAAGLVLGVAFWLGHARSLTRLHIGLGVGLILCVWAASWIGWRKTRRGRLAVAGVLCGVVIWIFGVSQSTIMPGPLHWVVKHIDDSKRGWQVFGWVSAVPGDPRRINKR